MIKTIYAGDRLQAALARQRQWFRDHGVEDAAPGKLRMAPPFPPNREIAEGEPCCAICGSGRLTHEDGTRQHRFQLRMAKASLHGST